MVRIGIINARVGVIESGGTETFIREMMKRLSHRHKVICYTGTGRLLEEIEQLDIQIKQIPYLAKGRPMNDAISKYTPVLSAEIESFSMFWNAWRRGVLEQIEQEVDVLSTHYYLDNILVSRLLDVPMVFHSAGIRSPSWRWKAMSRLAKPNLSLANSRSTARRLKRWLNIDVNGVVYPGVDVEQFDVDCAPAFEDNQISILYVGRIDEGKGLKELLEAHSRLSNVSLYLVGNGQLVEELRDQARKLGTDKNVHFVGSVPHEKVHRYYAGADIFCLPSHHESLGIVNLEAMASGCSVVSTRIDAIEEYVDDGKNGLLVEPGDVDALTSALWQLVNDTELRKSVALAGRETAIEYGWDAQSRRLEEYYVEATQH